MLGFSSEQSKDVDKEVLSFIASHSYISSMNPRANKSPQIQYSDHLQLFGN